MYHFLEFDEDTTEMNRDNLSLPSTHVHFNPAVKPRSRLGRRRVPQSNDDRRESSRTPMQPPVGRVWSRDDSGISTGNDTTPSSRLPFAGGDQFWKNGRHQAELRPQDGKSNMPSSNVVAQNENKPLFGKFAHPSTPSRFLKNEPLKEITDVYNNVVDPGNQNEVADDLSLSSSQPSLGMKEATKLPSLQKQLNTSFCNDSLPVMNINESLSHSNVGNKTSNETFKSDDTSFLTAHDIQRPDFLTNRTFYDPEFLKTPGRNLAEIRIEESPFNPLEGFPDRSDGCVMEHSETPLQSKMTANLALNGQRSDGGDTSDQQSKETGRNAFSLHLSDTNGHPLAPEVIYENDAPVLCEFSGNNTNRFGRASCSKQLPFDKDPHPPEVDNMDTSPLALVTQNKMEGLRTKVESNNSSHKKFLGDTSNVTYPQSSCSSMPPSNGFSSQFSQTPAARNGGADSTWSNRTTDTFPLKSLNLNSFAKRPDVTYPSKVSLAKQSSIQDKDIFVMSVSEDLYQAESSNKANQTPKPESNVGRQVSNCRQSVNLSNLWASGKSSFTNTPTVVQVNVSSQDCTHELMDDHSSHTRDYTVKAAPAKPSANNLRPNTQGLGQSLSAQPNRVEALPQKALREAPSNCQEDMKTVIVRPVQDQSHPAAPASQYVAQMSHHNPVQPNVMAEQAVNVLNCNNTSIPSVLKPQPQNVIRIKGVPYTVLSLLGKGGSSQVYQALGPQSSKLMAIKCVNLSQAEEAMAADYLNEIELLSKLQGCPCVIKMFDSEYVPQTQMLYVVLEKGDTDFSKLVKNISETKQISMPMIIYYWSEMLNAVHEIHKRDIIHSDLKPANFLLVEGRLKLIDFGIASSIQGDTTSVMKEVPAGTYNYMSPESITGPKITRKSDVWSLGCILFNLLYGKTPFGHLNHRWQKLHAIVDPNHKVTFPKLSVHAPPSLRLALRWCLNKDPTARPTVEDLVKLSELSPHVDSPLGKEIDNMMVTYYKKVIPDLKALKEEDNIK